MLFRSSDLEDQLLCYGQLRPCGSLEILIIKTAVRFFDGIVASLKKVCHRICDIANYWLVRIKAQFVILYHSITAPLESPLPEPVISKVSTGEFND